MHMQGTLWPCFTPRLQDFTCNIRMAQQVESEDDPKEDI